MAWETKNNSDTSMKMTVHPKQRNIQRYMVNKSVILDQIYDMIASFHSKNYGEDV